MGLWQFDLVKSAPAQGIWFGARGYLKVPSSPNHSMILQFYKRMCEIEGTFWGEGDWQWKSMLQSHHNLTVWSAAKGRLMKDKKRGKLVFSKK